MATTTANIGAGVNILYDKKFIRVLKETVRIVPLGQTDGQRIIARLSQTVKQSVAKAQSTPLDSLATSTLMVDVMSMRHERQYTRLFRS